MPLRASAPAFVPSGLAPHHQAAAELLATAHVELVPLEEGEPGWPEKYTAEDHVEGFQVVRRVIINDYATYFALGEVEDFEVAVALMEVIGAGSSPDQLGETQILAVTEEGLRSLADP